MPIFSWRLQSRTAPQTAPLWLRKAMGPGWAITAAGEAFRPRNGFMTPKLFGPRSRIRPRPASARTSRSSSAQARPVSRNPEDVMIAARTPTSTHWPTNSGTRGAGAMIRARSIGSGTSPTLG